MSQANKHRQHLRLKPYRQKTLAYKWKWKLSPRYFGPFHVLQKIGAVAYELDLPPKSKVHPIFHVSCLKPKLGQHVIPFSTLPPVDEDDQETTKLIVVLQLRTKTLRTRVISEVLVQWLGSPPEDATWESLQ